jgi:uncharacterized membrane protein HdeD (DUF308 family)
MLKFTQPLSRGNAALRGVVAAAVGVGLIAWPSITLGAVTSLFAIFAFADAIASGVRAFGSGRTAGDRVLLAMRSAIGFAAGVVAVAYPGATVGAMTVIIGIYAIATGVNELMASSRLSRLGLGGTGWLVLDGVLAVITGIVLVVWPGIGAVTLAIVFGIYLAASGLTLLVSAAVTPRGESVPNPA